ncbi:MAG: hypothetical protein HYW26_05115 [Candidatus Aenigmarchaeota archaeon]|nr:hypothetical protein [Candidatus Aenigmarchaeota archaeon]
MAIIALPRTEVSERPERNGWLSYITPPQGFWGAFDEIVSFFTLAQKFHREYGSGLDSRREKVYHYASLALLEAAADGPKVALLYAYVTQHFMR